jgi:hypothetical protein
VRLRTSLNGRRKLDLVRKRTLQLDNYSLPELSRYTIEINGYIVF